MLAALIRALDMNGIPHHYIFGVAFEAKWKVESILDSAITVSVFFWITMLLYQYSITFAWDIPEYATEAGSDINNITNTTTESGSDVSSGMNSAHGLATVCPLIFLWLCAAGVMVYTIGVPCCKSREFLWKTLPRVLVAPFVVPTFADSWVSLDMVPMLVLVWHRCQTLPQPICLQAIVELITNVCLFVFGVSIRVHAFGFIPLLSFAGWRCIDELHKGFQSCCRAGVK